MHSILQQKTKAIVKAVLATNSVHELGAHAELSFFGSNKTSFHTNTQYKNLTSVVNQIRISSTCTSTIREVIA